VVFGFYVIWCFFKLKIGLSLFSRKSYKCLFSCFFMKPRFENPLKIGNLELGLLFVDNGCLDSPTSMAVRAGYDMTRTKLNYPDLGFEVSEHDNALNEFNRDQGNYNIVIVNHDSGRGLLTLPKLITDSKTIVPVGYVAPVDSNTLYGDFLQAAHGLNDVFDPKTFGQFRIRVLSTVDTDNPTRALTEEVHRFLRYTLYRKQCMVLE